MGGLLVLFETQKIGYRLISLCRLLTFFNEKRRPYLNLLSPFFAFIMFVELVPFAFMLLNFKVRRISIK